MNTKRIEEIKREVPGCEIHVVQRLPNGATLVLYVPPEEDRKLGLANPAAAFQRVNTNMLIVVPADDGAPLDASLH